MTSTISTTKRANMKTIAIISQKGGAGKTTVAIHLAVAAEQRGMKTALFDLDPQASASSWSDKRNQPSPVVVSAKAARLPSLLEQAMAQFADLVIIDSAPNADSASLAAARAADLILIPCRPVSHGQKLSHYRGQMEPPASLPREAMVGCFGEVMSEERRKWQEPAIVARLLLPLRVTSWAA
jgi:CobQ/CobB/MinD/ParA nucleotide binding domain